MAWNRPRECGRAVSEKQPRQDYRSSHTVWCVGVAIVVLGATVAAWWLWPSDESEGETPPPQTKQRIKEVKPSTAKTVRPRTVWRPKTKPEMTARLTPPSRTTTDVFDFGALPSNCLLKASIFGHSSEGMVAGILTAVPGDHFLSDDWDENFVEDFKVALKNPTPIGEKDSADDRLVKEAVGNAMKLLASYMEAGEDINEIMRDAQREIEKITAYRDQLDEALRSYLDENDVEGAKKFCAEANELLAEYNARPLEVSKGDILQVEIRLMKAESENRNGAKE